MNEPQKILVIRFSSLGDIILTTPVYKNLKTAWNHCHITVAVKEKYAGILEGNPDVDQLLVLREAESIFSFVRRVRKEKFSILIDLHNNLRSNLVSLLSGATQKIRYKKAFWKRRLFVRQRVQDPELERHTIHRYLDALKNLGITTQFVRPEIQMPLSAAQFDFNDLLSVHDIRPGKILVGINPGSVWKTKQWLPERFAEVADRLMDESDCKIILFGSNKDSDSVESVRRSMKHSAINLCGKTDLKQLAGLIARCALFITNDSGPMHLACAANVPVVAIFGTTTKELGFFPCGEKSVVVELKLPCRPCTLHGSEKCPLTHFRCMREITTEMVLEPCRKFLAENIPHLDPLPASGQALTQGQRKM